MAKKFRPHFLTLRTDTKGTVKVFVESPRQRDEALRHVGGRILERGERCESAGGDDEVAVEKAPRDYTREDVLRDKASQAIKKMEFREFLRQRCRELHERP